MTYSVNLPTVKTSTVADSGFATEAELYVTSLKRNLQPRVDSAEMIFHYGTIDGSYVSPLALIGKFVTVTNTGLLFEWIGYCVGERRSRRGEETITGPAQRVSGGDQVFQVVGLEWFLGRRVVATDRVVNEAISQGATQFKTLKRGVGFNVGAGDGRQIEMGRAANKSPAGLAFEFRPELAVAWTLKDAIDYMLAFHYPQDEDGNAEPLAFELATLDAGVEAYLDAQPAPPIRTEGRSVLQVLNRLLPSNRGLVWWTEYNSGSPPTIQLHIDTMATSAVTMPGGVADLPANTGATTIDVDAILGIRTVEIQRDLTREYDQVVCRGARRRSVFTVSLDAETLKKGWTEKEEQLYIEGASKNRDYALWSNELRAIKNDRVRSGDYFERVYSRFTIPADWDGKAADGAAFEQDAFVAPTFATQNGGGAIEGTAPFAVAGMRLLPTMPIVAGVDYTVAANPVDETEGQNTVNLPPFAFVDLTGQDETWSKLDRLGVVSIEESEIANLPLEWDGFDTDYDFFVVPGEPSFDLRPRGNVLSHNLAFNHYFPDADEPPSETEPQINYLAIRATVCVEFDSYCEGFAPDAAITSDPKQVLYIDIGERARLDYLANGTVFDIAGGELQKVRTGGFIRDDRNLCLQVATLAQQWYDTDRSQLRIAIDRIDTTAVDLGALVTSVGTGASAETVNAVVSSIAYGWHNAHTTLITAGFTDLDFSELV